MGEHADAAARTAQAAAPAARPERPEELLLFDIKSFVARAPKIETHIHLDGAWDIDYLYEQTKKHQDNLPEEVVVPITEQVIKLREVVRNLKSVDDLKKLMSNPDVIMTTIAKSITHVAVYFICLITIKATSGMASAMISSL